MLRCMCFAGGCFQDVAMGDDEAESPIWVQFKIGAAVRKKSRVDDEIRDF